MTGRKVRFAWSEEARVISLVSGPLLFFLALDLKLTEYSGKKAGDVSKKSSHANSSSLPGTWHPTIKA